MKTPLQEFIEEATKNLGHNSIPKDVIDRYLEKEKQTIINICNNIRHPKNSVKTGEEYYNELTKEQ